MSTLNQLNCLTKRFRQKAFIVWFFVLLLLVILLTLYLFYRRFWPYTDDAYINANYVEVAAQVSGPVAQIYIKNNQFVHKNQLLFVIDQRPFQATVHQMQANLRLARQQMESDEAAVQVAQARVKQTQATFIVAKKDYNRTATLVKKGEDSIADGDQALGDLQSSQADFIAAKKQLLQAQRELGEPGERNAQIQLAKAELVTAKLNLSYTKVYASEDSFVTNFQLRPGTMIEAEQPLFQLIENNSWWVDANYKETQIKRIKSGQKAVIKIDIYPNKKFIGYVDSISRGSGEVFSLLPPENASGNWVKVTQRFPVKIIIKNSQKYPLRVGASSEVIINTLEKAS